MSLVELARYSDAALAHIVKGRLEAADIPAFCFDTGANVMEGIPMLFKVRVMVHSDDLTAARALIAEDDGQDDAEMRHDAGAGMTRRIEAGYGTRRRWAAGCFLLMMFSIIVLPSLIRLIMVVARSN